VRAVSFLQVFSDTATGLSLGAFGPPAPVGEDGADQDEELDDLGVAPASVVRREPPVGMATPVATAPRPELEGVGHALHEVRTDVATRVLIRALADDPGAALTALVARMFDVVVLGQGRGRGDGALTLEAEAYSRPRTAPIEAAAVLSRHPVAQVRQPGV
jgi:ParB family chromosome partitioning protein